MSRHGSDCFCAPCLLETWAERTWQGRLASPLPSGGVRRGLEDRALLVCLHVEGFWVSTEHRKIFRGHCMEEWAKYGVPWPPAPDVLEDVSVQHEMMSQFAEWLEAHPMPPIHHVPIDDGSGAIADDAQWRAKKIGADDVGKMLGVDERHARRLLDAGEIAGWKERGEWVTTVGDVLAHRLKQNGGKRPGSGRKKKPATFCKDIA